MKAYARSIFHLFDGKRRYIVPLFQRQYVWNREKQWEPLWEDVCRVAETKSENVTAPPHFLGAMVLDQIRTYGNQVPAHLIIDGQQRLTTFQIMLAALRDVARNVDAPDFGDEVQRYLENTGIMENRDEERFKVWPSKVDQEAFKIMIDSPASKQVESYFRDNKSLIIQAYQYFHSTIKNYVSSENPQRQVEHLYQVLRQDLEVVSIELDGDDDPQVIFETLNARGEPLLPSDLLRNFIFWRASRKNEEKDALYEKYWLPFDQKFWKHEERLGRLKRPRIDIFMQHYLESQGGQEVNIGRLFYEYKNWIKEHSPFETVEAELQSLTRQSVIFRELIEADLNASNGAFFWRLKKIDVGTIYPLLLFVLNHPERGERDVAGMLLDLESYLFRRLVCGLTPKNYNRMFLQFVRDLIKDGFSRETLQKSLLRVTGDAGIWPDDKMFGEAWLNRNVYSEIRPGQRIVVVLRAIEDALRQEKNEKMLIQSPLTIEHIMPQSWEKTWPLADGTHAKERFARLVEGNRNAEADGRDSCLHRFGNLTLLTQPLNSSVSNSRWEEKRPEIINQSALALNRYFQECPTWDVGAIQERGRKLLDVAIKVWPYPSDK